MPPIQPKSNVDLEPNWKKQEDGTYINQVAFDYRDRGSPQLHVVPQGIVRSEEEAEALEAKRPK